MTQVIKLNQPGDPAEPTCLILGCSTWLPAPELQGGSTIWAIRAMTGDPAPGCQGSSALRGAGDVLTRVIEQ